MPFAMNWTPFCAWEKGLKSTSLVNYLVRYTAEGVEVLFPRTLSSSLRADHGEKRTWCWLPGVPRIETDVPLCSSMGWDWCVVGRAFERMNERTNERHFRRSFDERTNERTAVSNLDERERTNGPNWPRTNERTAFFIFLYVRQKKSHRLQFSFFSLSLWCWEENQSF